MACDFQTTVDSKASIFYTQHKISADNKGLQSFTDFSVAYTICVRLLSLEIFTQHVEILRDQRKVTDIINNYLFQE